MGAALAKQIPALIKGFLKVAKPPGGIADLTWVLLHLAAQLMLSIDHRANARENVGVVHATSLREPRCGAAAIQCPKWRGRYAARKTRTASSAYRLELSAAVRLVAACEHGFVDRHRQDQIVQVLSGEQRIGHLQDAPTGELLDLCGER